MWVIFLQNTPHFWLISGESYRVGKKDCHIIIPDDRSISRTHLTIIVTPHSSTGVSASSECVPQPIALLDSSTYGTTIVACGEESEDAETLDDTPPPPPRGGGGHAGAAGAAGPPALETGVFGLCYSPAAVASVTAPRKGHCSSPTSSCRASESALQLTKDVSFHVPVHHSCWRQFKIQLGHRGAELKLVWVDVLVLCEDIDLEVQAKLFDALRCCGVRHETNAGGIEAVSATETQGSAEGCLSCDDVAPGRRSSTVTPPGCSGLSSSPQTTTPGAVAATPSPTAVVAAAAGTTAAAGATEGTGPSQALSRCYNAVSFLVTSTVQPSTAVVAMLCRAVPIVTPDFFVAICNRVSPQTPLPDPLRYLPPLSSWWCDLLTHIAPSTDNPRLCGGDAESSGTSATVSSLATPSITRTEMTGEAAQTTAAASRIHYFAPQSQRRQLFEGITFILLQWPLCEEVLNYLDKTGARVEWEEGGIHRLSAPLSASSLPPRAVLDTLQSFFLRHQRHVLLYNETEPLLPWPGCVDVVRHGLSLCSVEYGTLIEAIVAVRPLPLPAYPADAQMPQTLEEVEARVAAATESTSPAAAEQEGRRTDAQPLFPELGGGGGGALGAALLPNSNGGIGQSDMSDTRVHRRPRKEETDGWVTFEKSATVAPVLTGHSTDKPNSNATVRTVELHMGPHSLPPYPCFEDANIASADVSANEAGVLGLARSAKRFVKQALPPAEPLVELEEHRVRRRFATSILTACAPTVDAEGVVPEEVVMGCGGLASRVVEATNAAFNAFDTAVHHASSKRRGTVTRRKGRGGSAGASTSAAVATPSAPRIPRGGTASTCPTANIVFVEDDEDIALGSVKATAPQGGRGSVTSASAVDTSAFHIFDIDGIF
ncbi:hypothetical protein JKF63_07099 [Porcisia hertigi]|uniref:FHA domain-containing protein n=1 Tax=Porcisia hertigi TaxID=2761500 RepID=A0A836YHL3_9TRYP|nr:hypothetical protein JKF63_07099 [Porcisia hertigi]